LLLPAPGIPADSGMTDYLFLALVFPLYYLLSHLQGLMVCLAVTLKAAAGITAITLLHPKYVFSTGDSYSSTFKTTHLAQYLFLLRLIIIPYLTHSGNSFCRHLRIQTYITVLPLTSIRSLY
jgi:hypothetical protein